MVTSADRRARSLVAAPAQYQAFTDGLKAVPFKERNLIRVSLGRSSVPRAGAALPSPATR